jgi:hypothetical protein
MWAIPLIIIAIFAEYPAAAITITVVIVVGWLLVWLASPLLEERAQYRRWERQRRQEALERLANERVRYEQASAELRDAYDDARRRLRDVS